MVIPLTNASAQPHAMVVVPQDTIVAGVTMRRPWRPENPAHLTKFKFEQ